jgi:superfamily II DNA or RNA helicase
LKREPRYFQVDAVDASLNALKRGVKKQIIALPTGTGKTVTCVLLGEKGQFKRILFCVDAEELVEQAALAFLREKFDDSLINHIEEIGFIDYVRKGGLFAGGEYKVGLIKADIFQPHGNVVIASLQTLRNRLHLLNPADFDLIIIDECHIAGAKTIQNTLNHFTPELLLGVTATPFRSDNVDLGSIFDEIVYEYDITTAIKEGYLCNLDAVKVRTNINIDSVHTLGGEFNQKELAEEVDCPERNFLVADSYLKYAKGRQMIGYTVDIDHAIHLADACIEKGIKATAISSKEELTGDRSQKVKDFKAGKYNLVFNCGILVKGFDMPNLGGVIHACPTKSLVKWKQATGRCTRLKDDIYVDKWGQEALIIDIVDSTSRHSLINAHNLDKELDIEDRVYITSEKREKLLEARKRRIEGKTDKDERVQLLPIRNPKYKTKIASEPIDEMMFNFLRNYGYKPEENAYTKENYREILSSFPATSDQLIELRQFGFNMNSPITRGQASYTLWLYKNDKLKVK